MHDNAWTEVEIIKINQWEAQHEKVKTKKYWEKISVNFWNIRIEQKKTIILHV